MDFQGFQNSFSPLVIVLIILVLLAIAFFSYRRLTSIPLIPRLSLGLLRFSTLCILFILFLNPYFFSSKEEEKKPRIAILLDNSESVSIKKGEYLGKESYIKVIEDLKFEANSNLELEYFTIGSNSKQIKNPTELEFSDTETNLSNALSQLFELEDSFDASIILSDGIITYGSNPIIQASNSSIPLYTILLGDSSLVKDITINNVITNPNGYVNTNHIIEVEVSQNGFSNTSTTVGVKDSRGNVLNQKSLFFNQNEEIVSETFEIELMQEGLQQLTVFVTEEAGEWSLDNNSFSTAIVVSDSKVRVLDIAFEIHPDVKAFRATLSKDEHIELTTLTWLNGNNFVEDDLPESEEFNLVVFHGQPTNSFDESILSNYFDTPTLYFHLPKTRRITTGMISQFSQISNPGNQLFEVSLVPALENESHPILELPDIGYKNISLLVSSLRTNSNSPDGLNLFKSGFQGLETPNAVITILERGNLRRATVSAWGWYKMTQSPSEAEREFATQLFSNITSWLASNPDDRKLKIEPSKSSYNLREEVILNGNLKNESGENEEAAIIEIVINKDNDEERIFNMQNNGGGAYSLNIKQLSSGLYTFKSTARKNNREIDSQIGEFIVEDSNTELFNTVRNDDLMRGLSNETGGEHFVYNELETFWSTLNSDRILETKIEQLESYVFPVRNMFWFITVLLLLATEWILRKKYSLP